MMGGCTGTGGESYGGERSRLKSRVVPLHRCMDGLVKVIYYYYKDITFFVLSPSILKLMPEAYAMSPMKQSLKVNAQKY